MKSPTDTARVSALFWCPEAGAPMIAASRLSVEQGRGVAKDRYALGTGAYSAMEPIKDRHLTLITQDAIDTANAWQQASGREPFDAALTRRNVVIESMSAQSLNDLVGKRFLIGSVLCEGLEFATPCERPSTLSGIDGFPEAFDGRGGLRARVLSSGPIDVGMSLALACAATLATARRNALADSGAA